MEADAVGLFTGDATGDAAGLFVGELTGDCVFGATGDLVTGTVETGALVPGLTITEGPDVAAIAGVGVTGIPVGSRLGASDTEIGTCEVLTGKLVGEAVGNMDSPI